jgi:hypothetical protein
MPYAAAPGTPNYSGTFTPEIWSGKLLEKFYDASVLPFISNSTYEGEIKSMGDKVKIRTVPSIVIRNYVMNQNLTVDRPESPIVELNIDKGKYFQVVLDDVAKVQNDIDQMNMWSSDASEQLKITIDSDVLLNVAVSTDIVAANRGATAGRISQSIDLGVTGSPFQLTKSNILDKIVDLGTVLDEQNIPETGRFVVMPAWAAALIKKSDLKDASLAGDGTSIMRNGRVGMIDRFTVYVSNLLGRYTDGVTTHDILAGHQVGLAFASQFTNTETLRGESTFGTIMRGLQVYGYKIVKGDALARAYVRQ